MRHPRRSVEKRAADMQISVARKRAANGVAGRILGSAAELESPALVFMDVQCQTGQPSSLALR